jgi:1-phosphofructokinase
MSAPVITVTLNPAIDQTISLARLDVGQVQQAEAVRYDAGGKGINVASCLADWGTKIIACGVLGADNDAAFQALFTAKSIDDRFIRIAGQTRMNIKLAHGGQTTDINLPGLTVQDAPLHECRTQLLEYAAPGRLFVLAGSLPSGVPAAFYHEMIAALAERGARVILDTSNAALFAALQGPVLPFCVKPNRHELEKLTGEALPTIPAVLHAARSLLRRGVGLVVVSLGEQGAIFVGPDAEWHAYLPVLRCASSVGAGDAMVAGIVAALLEGADLARTARLATAFAAGKLGLTGAHLPAPSVIESLATAVVLEQPTRL